MLPPLSGKRSASSSKSMSASNGTTSVNARSQMRRRSRASGNRKWNDEGEPSGKGIVQVRAEFRGQDRESVAAPLHALQQMRDLDISVTIVAVSDLGALPEQGIRLVEEEDTVPEYQARRCGRGSWRSLQCISTRSSGEIDSPTRSTPSSSRATTPAAIVLPVPEAPQTARWFLVPRPAARSPSRQRPVRVARCAHTGHVAVGQLIDQSEVVPGRRHHQAPQMAKLAACARSSGCSEGIG